MISFTPEKLTSDLLAELPDRVHEVLQKRYGLNSNGEKFTLETIGQAQGVTRERVRQIENFGLKSVQKTDAYQKHYELFMDLRRAINELGGGLIAEQVLLRELSIDPVIHNHLYFLLLTGDMFYKSKENSHYVKRWYTEREVMESVEVALQNVRDSLQPDDLVSEKEIIDRLQSELLEASSANEYNEAVLRRWLLLSKKIDRNAIGDWGHADSPHIRIRGVRDYAYLTVKRHGSPMHFREVAKAIEETFGHKAHAPTTHNELIKDNRFVLVGRGLYALVEWGYVGGLVKEVIQNILENEGPLSREEIILKVRKERYVKSGTIVVNLQDTNLFKRLANGTYTVVS